MARSLVRLACLTIALAAAACSPDGAGATPVPCNVEGGACPAGSICVHVCDCCGIPPDPDAGLVPSGHDTCVPDEGQCGGAFFVDSRTCHCRGDREADCPCA